MELREPIQRALDQKPLHLSAAEIVDERVPIAMETLAGILVLVKRRAVEAREAVRIVREMARHPIEDHADIGAVTGIDKLRKVLRRAVAGGRRELGERLIAPRAAEWMFHDREQFHMGE